MTADFGSVTEPDEAIRILKADAGDGLRADNFYAEALGLSDGAAGEVVVVPGVKTALEAIRQSPTPFPLVLIASMAVPALAALLRRRLPSAGFVVLAGSLPSAWPRDAYATLLAVCREAGVPALRRRSSMSERSCRSMSIRCATRSARPDAA